MGCLISNREGLSKDDESVELSAGKLAKMLSLDGRTRTWFLDRKVVCDVGWLLSRLLGWVDGFLVGCFDGWNVEYSEGRLNGWRVGWPIGCIRLFKRTCCILNRRIRSRLSAGAIDRLLCDKLPIRLKGRCSVRFYTQSHIGWMLCFWTGWKLGTDT